MFGSDWPVCLLAASYKEVYDLILNYINDSNRHIIINQFPNSKTIEVSNAGHWVHAENLNDFVKETLLFLKY